MLAQYQYCHNHPTDKIIMICKEEGCDMALVCSKCVSLNHKKHDFEDLELHEKQIMESVTNIVSKAKTKIGELDGFDTSSMFKKLDELMRTYKESFFFLQSKILTLLQTEMKRGYYSLWAIKEKLKRELKNYQKEKNELKKIDKNISEEMRNLGDMHIWNSNSLERIEKCRTEVDSLSKYANSKVEDIKNKNISDILERIFQTEMRDKKMNFILNEETISDCIQIEIKELNERMSKIINNKYHLSEEQKSPNLDPKEPCQLCPNIILNSQPSFRLKCGHFLHINCIKNHRIIRKCPKHECQKAINSEDTRELRELGLMKIQHIPKGVISQMEITKPAFDHVNSAEDVMIGNTGWQHSPIFKDITARDNSNKKCADCRHRIKEGEDYLCICDEGHNIHIECVRRVYLSEAPKICPLLGCIKKISSSGKLAIEKEISRKNERKYSSVKMCTHCYFPLGKEFTQFTCNHKFHLQCINEIYTNKDLDVYICHTCGKGSYDRLLAQLIIMKWLISLHLIMLFRRKNIIYYSSN